MKLKFNKIPIVRYIIIAIIAFGIGFWFKYPVVEKMVAWQYQIKMTQQETEKKNIENKVKIIMLGYGCTNFIIRDAIVQTKYPVLMACMIGQESGYNPLAISPMGAKGLCQLTHYYLKPWTNWRDPVVNIQISDKLITEYMEYYKNDPYQIELTLASYNAGFPLVSKNNQIPNIEETKQYIKNILFNYKKVSEIKN